MRSDRRRAEVNRGPGFRAPDLGDQTGLRARVFLGLAVLAPLALYVATAAPGVTLVDSGELALACATLGIAHPPGFPLYVLLGHLFTLLPLGAEPARRLNLFSSLCAVMAVGTAFLLCRRLMEVFIQAEPRKKKQPPPSPSLPSDFLALCGALAFGFSLSLWSWAVVTEVYALNIFLVALLLYFAAAADWRKTSVTAGLALGVHHATVVMALPAAFFLAWKSRVPQKREWRSLLALFLAGLLVYLYLPIRAGQSPVFNWGDPRTVERFWWHVSAKQYRVHLFEAPVEELLEHVAYFFKLWVRQFTPIGFLLVILGLLALVRRHRTLFWFTALLMAFNVAFTVNYDIGEDIEGYYLPTFLAGSWCFAIGAESLGRRTSPRWRKALTAVILIVALLPAAVHFSVNNHRRDYIASSYVQNSLRGVEPGALIIASDWQFYSPWLYHHYVRNLRPDVAIIDTLMLRRGWYVDFLQRAYPELTAAAGAEMKHFRFLVNRFERHVPYTGAEIDRAFVALVEKLARTRLANGTAVYITSKIERRFLRDLSLAPQGLLQKFGLPAREVDLDLEGLQGRPLGPVEHEVRQIYVTMLTARATYLLHQDPHNSVARQQAEAALRLDPDFEPARKLLAIKP